MTGSLANQKIMNTFAAFPSVVGFFVSGFFRFSLLRRPMSGSSSAVRVSTGALCGGVSAERSILFSIQAYK